MPCRHRGHTETQEGRGLLLPAFLRFPWGSYLWMTDLGFAPPPSDWPTMPSFSICS